MTSKAARTSVVVVTRSARGTEALGRKLARALTAPAVVLLDGALGAGKTTLARGFVRALPGAGRVMVQSPTFAIARTYPTTPPVHHLDLYRLDDASALEPLGLWELLEDDRAISLVEWARDLVPLKDAIRIAIDADDADDDARRITVDAPQRFESLVATLNGLRRTRRTKAAGPARSA